MRADLREMLADTLSRQNIDETAPTTLDDGDGFRLLLPSTIPPHSLLDPFLSRLGIELRAHRAASNEANRLRLRVALHSGLLFREPSGSYAGTALKDCARLLDAQAGRDLLTENPGADMVVLLTDFFHQEVVAGGRSLDPGWFQRIQIKVKETNRYGWAYVPGVPPPPGEGKPSLDKPQPQPPSPSSSSVTVNVKGDSAINTIVGGNQYGRS
jgi:hypothetical protein